MNKLISVLTVLILFIGACGEDTSRQFERSKQQDDPKAVQEDRISDKKITRATFKVDNMVQSQDTL